MVPALTLFSGRQVHYFSEQEASDHGRTCGTVGNRAAVGTTFLKPGRWYSLVDSWLQASQAPKREAGTLSLSKLKVWRNQSVTIVLKGSRCSSGRQTDTGFYVYSCLLTQHVKHNIRKVPSEYPVLLIFAHFLNKDLNY